MDRRDCDSSGAVYARYFGASARAFFFITSLFWTILQWSVTSPAYDGPSQYTCVQPTLVDGAQATRHAAVPLGMSGSISFK
jgi:hypothetical protein